MAKTTTKKKKNEEKLFDVSTLAEKYKIPGWQLAALRQALGWADGKQVTESQFNKALDRLKCRPQGGGKL